MAGRLTSMSERSFEKLGISEGYILHFFVRVDTIWGSV